MLAESTFRHPLAGQVIPLLREYHTQACVARKLHRSRQAINQALTTWRAQTGKTDLYPDEIFSTAELSKELRVWPHILANLCRTSKVEYSLLPCCRQVFFTCEQANALRSFIADGLHLSSHDSVCRFCGEPFTAKLANDHKTSVCYDRVCRSKYHKDNKRQLLQSKGGRFTGWHIQLVEALKKFTLPTQGRWVTIGKAKRITKLSPMQLIWLDLRGLLATKPHRVKTWHGRPVKTYNVAQLEVVRDVYSAYQTTT